MKLNAITNTKSMKERKRILDKAWNDRMKHDKDVAAKLGYSSVKLAIKALGAKEFASVAKINAPSINEKMKKAPKI